MTATREKRILAMIDFCENNPYLLCVRELHMKFKLYSGEIINLIEKLNLEVKHYKDSNVRREVETYLKNFPELTKSQLIEMGYSEYKIRVTALTVDHYFRTEKTIDLETIGAYYQK